MIDGLVLEQMHSFEALDDYVKTNLVQVLESAQTQCTSQFEKLFAQFNLSEQRLCAMGLTPTRHPESPGAIGSTRSRNPERPCPIITETSDAISTGRTSL